MNDEATELMTLEQAMAPITVIGFCDMCDAMGVPVTLGVDHWACDRCIAEALKVGMWP